MKLDIAKWRKKFHMSQKDFADSIGVTIRTVGSWEKGRTFPNAEQLWNVCLLFKCSPNEFLDWDSSDSITESEREIVENYRDSSPEWQQNISMTARAAASESKGK